MQRRHWLGWGMAGSALVGWVPRSLRAATPGIDAPPEPGAPPPLRVPTVQGQRLANGLQMLVVTRPGLPLVTAALHQRAGREADPPGLAGLAALTAALLAKGAWRGDSQRSATEIAREAETLGSALDVNTGWQQANLAMTVTTPKLAAALDLMADLVRAPLFEAAELERQRAQMLDALRVSMAAPGDVAAMAARRAYWGASAYGASATVASLARIKREQLLSFHLERYQPDQAVLVLAGDISIDAALLMATRSFGSWQGKATALALPAPAHSSDAATVLIDMPGSGQSGVVLVAPFAAVNDAEHRIAEVAAAVLGGGYSARLNQEIRIKRGLSYGAFGGGESQRSGGMFSAQVQTDHPNAAQVAALMRELVLGVARESLPRAELLARQATLVGSFARQLGTTAGLAALVASSWLQGRGLDALARYADEVLAVTPEQVRDYAARYWTAAALRTVVSLDLKVATVTATATVLPADALRVRLSALDLESDTLGAVPPATPR